MISHARHDQLNAGLNVFNYISKQYLHAFI